MSKNTAWIAMSALAALLVVGTASAEEARPLKDRSCTGECRRQHGACVTAARAEARMCAAETCAAEQDAVHAACEAAPRSEECAAARAELRSCLRPCLEDYREALRACRARAKECVEQCPAHVPPPRPAAKDPLCVGECRAQLSHCMGRVRQAHLDCQNTCQDLIAGMREACAAGRVAACTAARQTLQDCLSPCNQALRDGTARCTRASHACVAECPDRPTRPVPPRPLRGQ